jgi:mono/diheme cytochrome c family protein
MKMQWNATGSVQTNASRPDQRCTRFTCGRGIRTIRSSFPKMRAPVETCTTARTTAAVANHAFPAIVEEKTDVMASEYVEFTLASTGIDADPTGYDRRVSRPWRRLVLVPAILFVVVSTSAFTLAKLHLAKPGLPKSGSVKLGDLYRGETVFSTSCSSCHGDSAQGGIGPKLAGAHISLAAAKAQIDNGGATMPPKLVQGRQEEDVLAYLSTIFAPGG